MGGCPEGGGGGRGTGGLCPPPIRFAVAAVLRSSWGLLKLSSGLVGCCLSCGGGNTIRGCSSCPGGSPGCCSVGDEVHLRAARAVLVVQMGSAQAVLRLPSSWSQAPQVGGLLKQCWGAVGVTSTAPGAPPCANAYMPMN